MFEGFGSGAPLSVAVEVQSLSGSGFFDLGPRCVRVPPMQTPEQELDQDCRRLLERLDSPVGTALAGLLLRAAQDPEQYGEDSRAQQHGNRAPRPATTCVHRAHAAAVEFVRGHDSPQGTCPASLRF